MRRVIPAPTTIWILFIGLLLGSITVMAAPRTQQAGSCSGFSSNLIVGEQGVVTPGEPNNVRTEPAIEGERVGQIPGDGVFTILDGPLCAGDITWWMVLYENIIGWTGEGTGATRWLVSYDAETYDPDAPPGVLEGTLSSALYNMQFCLALDGQTTFFATDANGEPTTINNGGTATFSVGQGNLSFAPGVCATETLRDSAFAITPAGVRLDLNQPELNAISEHQGVIRVTLPLYAYVLPGTWTLGIGGQSIQVNVTGSNAPVWMFETNEFDPNNRATDWQILLAGFEPNERLMIVTAQEAADTEGQDADTIVQIEETLLMRRMDITQVQEFNPTVLQAMTDVVPNRATETLTRVSPAVAIQINPSVIEAIGEIANDDTTTSFDNPWRVTYEDVTGVEVRASDAGTYAGVIRTDKVPVAIIGESGTLLETPDLQELRTVRGRSVQQTLYNLFWANNPNAGEDETCTYTIQRGDTLARVARNNNITLSQLLNANPQITNPDIIHRGDLITIPGCGRGL